MNDLIEQSNTQEDVVKRVFDEMIGWLTGKPLKIEVKNAQANRRVIRF